MRSLTCVLLLCVSAAFAQQQSGPRAERNTEMLLARVAAAPRLTLERTELELQPPAAGWAIEMPSSVALGPGEVFYILQRGTNADPVVAVNSDGKVLRSWGRGLYTIPHSIRVDPDGNVWTVDSGSSQVYKFSPEGEQLLHIDVGEMPQKQSAFRGTSDIAFAPDGALLIADGYGNARILEYTPEGRRVREFGRSGSGPGELNLPHAVAVDERGIIYVGDRENGRIQRFTRQGEPLDRWEGLGKAYSLQLDGQSIWLGSHRIDQPNGSPGWIFRLDRDSGEALGVVETTGTHSISLTRSGEPVTGSQPDRILWFRRR
jgi:streptogramin lyase